MLTVHTGNILGDLLTKLDENISAGRKNPLSPATVCIQTAGMQRWIGLALARNSGISANLDFVFPGALMKRLAGVSARDRSPWPEKQELIWRVFDRLSNLPPEEIYENLNNYLSDDENSIKSYRLAKRIADTFDQYQVYRPRMVLDWLSPRPKELPENDQLWQVELFRSLFTSRDNCKTFVYDRFIKDCHKGRKKPAQLSEPIHIFGISVLPLFFLDMLNAASRHTDVHMYLLSPTRQYWGDAKTVREIRRLEKIHDKTAEEMYIEEKHTLLDNLGPAGRDFFDHIFGADYNPDDREYYRDVKKVSVLKAVQAEILDLEYGSETYTDDDSIIIDSVHNPMREAETLYDRLLSVFEKNPKLKPSDILVMTPDIEKYSPYIKAVFDNPYSEKERIPYSVADVSERRSSRPAGIFLELLEAVRGDFSLSEVFGIMSYDIVADSFGVRQSDLRTLAEVLESAGAFWGYDREHLKRNGLETDDTFTWHKALRRAALGLAEGDTRQIYNDAAASGMPFSLAEQIGGFMRFADLSSALAEELETEKTVPEWCSLLLGAVENFMKTDSKTADDMLYLTTCIANMSSEASDAGFDSETGFEPVLERLTEVLTETRGAKGFISGRVTFCAMLPMRSIPFKVICIMGLDENTFPRQKTSLEFDLMAKRPKPGDRNNRDSDRYLFLETIISAEEKLILSYVGQSERDNKELPPSTLITELCTHLKDRFGIDSPVTKHRLHSFSRHYFENKKLFTYSGDRFNAASAFSAAKIPHDFSSEPVSAETAESVDISDFESFFINPSKQFLSKTLEINTSLRSETLPEHEPLTMEGLAGYGLRNDALRERLSGTDPLETLEYLYKTAHLPPENLGEYYISETSEHSLNLSERVKNLLGAEPEAVEIDVEVEGLRITGRIEGVAGSRHIYCRPSELKPKDMIRGWIRHLLLNSISETSSILTGTEKELSIPPYRGNHLAELVKIYRKGLSKPLKFHITDGMNMDAYKIKNIKEDRHDRIDSDYAFRICFGNITATDEEVSETILKPIAEHLKGAK